MTNDEALNVLNRENALQLKILRLQDFLIEIQNHNQARGGTSHRINVLCKEALEIL